ncbi:MAG: hypothetical protein CMH82_16390 [Nocardioides sp.]|nr:hypothetical protein [Nocardioides sp.]
MLLGSLTACSTDVPATLVRGSELRVQHSAALTQLNPAAADASAADVELAALTRDGFARLVDGEVEVDEDFGDVTVVDAEEFTVRYDLAERTWSDGVVIDAADLVLAWVAEADPTGAGFDTVPGSLAMASEPVVDQQQRRIELTYGTEVHDWQTALDVAVPAHAVAALAWGVKDPMEAKKAVLDAVATLAAADLAVLAESWNRGFRVDGMQGALPGRITASSGPYEVASVGGATSPGSVVLQASTGYDGGDPPVHERIELRASVGPPLDGFPAKVDVVRLEPDPALFDAVRYLERRDHTVSYSHDGRAWMLLLRPQKALFGSVGPRSAFLRAAAAADLRQRGGGTWSEAYPSTRSLLFAPESDGYEIALEDAGLARSLSSDDVNADRERAGVSAGAEVCVLHDASDPFAVRAFAALSANTREAGWKISDCGVPALDSEAFTEDSWHALLAVVDLPEGPEQVAELWGEDSPWSAAAGSAVASLASRAARTADPYDYRDLLVAAEAAVVAQAVALPIAMDGLVTLTARDLAPLQPDSGPTATLLHSARFWEPVD